jgi:tetratricopeptide (TPR) repeat protein
VSGATREDAADTKAAEEAAKATIEGRYFLVQHRYDEALDKLQFALSLAPGDPEATRLLAQARAVHDDAQGHVDKAAALMKANRWDEAVQELNAATNVYPSCKEAKALLAEVNGKAAQSLLGSGQSLLAGGKPAEAEASLRKALDFAPDLPGAREGLARVAFQRADGAAARGLWGQALLWSREASQYMPQAPGYLAAAKEARDRVLARVRFTVGPAPIEGPAPTALASSFITAMWAHLVDSRRDSRLPLHGPSGGAERGLRPRRGRRAH